jgi:integrase/recombinase XerD
MTALHIAIDEYLRMRRGLGYGLVQSEAWLRSFADFMEAESTEIITQELALRWATQTQSNNLSYSAKRLVVLRGFARHYQACDPRTEVPAKHLLPHRPKRAKPYLYTLTEIQELMTAATTLPGLCGYTYACLRGLLSVSGLRISEALGLKKSEVDLREGLLYVHRAKFGKSRWVPLHPTTLQALREYGETRDTYPKAREAEYFFSTERGKRLSPSTVRKRFNELCRQSGLRGPEDHRGPRLHDLRHRFATEVLLRWYRSEEDISQRLPVLSTFLGHTRISDTYWYLSACPELLGEVVKRLAKREGEPR